jgi:hypothetical protein
MVHRIARVLEGGDDLTIEVLIVLDDEKTHGLSTSLLDRGHFPGGPVDHHMHHPAVLTQDADNVEVNLAVAAEHGAQHVGPRDGPPGGPDRKGRSDHLVAGYDNLHLALRETGPRGNPEIGPAIADKPQQRHAEK